MFLFMFLSLKVWSWLLLTCTGRTVSGKNKTPKPNKTCMCCDRSFRFVQLPH